MLDDVRCSFHDQLCLSSEPLPQPPLPEQSTQLIAAVPYPGLDHVNSIRYGRYDSCLSGLMHETQTSELVQYSTNSN